MARNEFELLKYATKRRSLEITSPYASTADGTAGTRRDSNIDVFLHAASSRSMFRKIHTLQWDS